NCQKQDHITNIINVQTVILFLLIIICLARSLCSVLNALGESRGAGLRIFVLSVSEWIEKTEIDINIINIGFDSFSDRK
ncbi:MAG TPA: hypothetical protein DCZ40_10225, partial [Lachnospiraceae bacterium]|nr:hypothetical protein [Lachnospiraceae bacterium]